MHARTDVYELITERIIDKLGSGAVPWHKPWTDAGPPMSLVKKRPYRGVNVFLLASTGYESPYWLTWNQLKKLDGSVKKGEKACPVVFWKWYEKRTDDTDDHGDPVVMRRPVLRFYRVFNTQQCRGIEDSVSDFSITARDHDRIAAAVRTSRHMQSRATWPLSSSARACGGRTLSGES